MDMDMDMDMDIHMDIHMDMDMGHGEAEMCRRRQTHKDEHAATEREALAAAQQPPRPHCVGDQKICARPPPPLLRAYWLGGGL